MPSISGEQPISHEISPDLQQAFETRFNDVSQVTRETAQKALLLGEKPAAQVLDMHTLVDDLVRNCQLSTEQHPEYINQIHWLMRQVVHGINMGMASPRQSEIVTQGTADVAMALKDAMREQFGSVGSSETTSSNETHLS